MQKFSARYLHNNPSKVYPQAHRRPVIITHQSHGEFLLISPTQILSKHTHIDGTIRLHLRSTDQLDDINCPKPEEPTDAASFHRLKAKKSRT